MAPSVSSSKTDLLCLCLVFLSQVHHIPGLNYLPTNNVHIPTHAYKTYGTTVLSYVSKQVTWNEASYICRELYPHGAGTLVMLQTFEAQKALRSELTLPAPWIGLHWYGTSLQWDDAHCSDFDEEQLSNFGVGHGNLNSLERCYYIDNNGLWKRSSCTAIRPFVCQHQDVDLALSCPINTKNGFLKSRARIETIARNGANHNTCTRLCGETQGCIMVYPGNKECIVAIVDDTDALYIRDTCYKYESIPGAALTYDLNNDPNPVTCVTIDTNFLTGGVPPASQAAESSAQCQANTVTVTDIVSVSTPCVTYSTTVVMEMATTSTCVIAPTATVTNLVTTTVFNDTPTGSRVTTPVLQASCPASTIQEQVTVTTTEVMMTTLVVTPPNPQVVTAVSTAIVPLISTTTATVTATLIQASLPCSLSSTPRSLSISSPTPVINVQSLMLSIVSELKMEPTSFSRYRRIKQSAHDGRISSKVSGAVAISILVLAFGCILLMDMTLLTPNILKLTAKIAAK